MGARPYRRQRPVGPFLERFLDRSGRTPAKGRVLTLDIILELDEGW